MTSALAFLCLALGAAVTNAQTTAFTYQGHLTETTNSPSGIYDFQFVLYNGANGIEGTQDNPGVSVASGVFTVTLDFGAAPFSSGSERYLEIRVKKPSDINYTTLSPRQRITSVPYAIRARDAAAADGLSAACEGCVTDAQIASVSGSKVTGSVSQADSATNASTANTAATAGNVTGIVGIANGGTGSSTQSFVDLTTAQTIGGAKTFTSPVNTSTQYNIGDRQALSFGVAGRDNLFAGLNSGNTNASNTGVHNSFFGTGSGSSITTGVNNSFVGFFAGTSTTAGGSNTFVGSFAGQSNTTGGSNVFAGSGAGRNNSIGGGNAFFGSLAGNLNTAGDNNSFLGTQAGLNNISGASNSFVGVNSGIFNTTGGSNSFVGMYAGQSNSSGSFNSFFGVQAGSTNQAGESNTVIGTFADLSGNRNFASAIGARAIASADDTIVIDKVAGNYTVGGISGARPADTVRIPGNLVVLGSQSLGSLTADPTGSNGMMYYNPTLSKFRCYENGAWANCISTAPGPILASDQQVVEKLQDQVRRQQVMIDELRKIICTENSGAGVCKE